MAPILVKHLRRPEEDYRVGQGKHPGGKGRLRYAKEGERYRSIMNPREPLE